MNSNFSERRSIFGRDISGSIELALAYNAITGSLNILIEQCSNLASAKRNQTSNPYVVENFLSIQTEGDFQVRENLPAAEQIQSDETEDID